MSGGFLKAFVIGLLLAAVGIFGVFYVKQTPRTNPQIQILKVRTQALDDNNTLAVLEVRLIDDSDLKMIVNDIRVDLDTKDNRKATASLLSGSDAKSIFKYYPNLGEQFNQPLLEQDQIEGHQKMDRMLVARFQLPERAIQERNRITVHITSPDGAVAESSSSTK